MTRVKNGATLKKHLLESHTAAEDVGRIADAAEVKVLVMSHLVPGETRRHGRGLDANEAKKIFNGRIVVARDLMELKLPV